MINKTSVEATGLDKSSSLWRIFIHVYWSLTPSISLNMFSCEVTAVHQIASANVCRAADGGI